MGALGLRVRTWVRRSRRLILIAAVLVGVASGLSIGVAAGTRRTQSAPDRYTAAFGGDPTFVITQSFGPPLTDRVRMLPGVVSATSITFITSFLVAPDDGSLVFEPNPFAGDTDFLGGRVTEGRLPDPGSPNELVVNTTLYDTLHDEHGVRVGDQLQVVSFDQDQVNRNAFDSGEGPALAPFTATLVGVVQAPVEFDDPSPSLTFPPSFLAAHPTVGVVQSRVAVELADGADPDAILDSVRALPGGDGAFATPDRLVSDDARRAVRFQVTALWLVLAVTALAAAAIVSQVIGRAVRTTADDRAALAASGWRPRDRAVERVVEGGLIVLLSIPVAIAVGFATAAVFPLGVLRSFEPHRGPTLDWTAIALGTLVVALVTGFAAAPAGHRSDARVTLERRPGRLTRLLAASRAGVPLTVGAGLVTAGPRGGRRSLGSIVAGAAGLAAIAGSVVVASSLTDIADTPSRWGVNYDRLFGNPYVPTTNDIVTPVLGVPGVAALTAATFDAVRLGGHDVPVFAFEAVTGGLVPVILEGRAPEGADEIGLGSEVARRLGVGVGDEIDAVGPNGDAARLRIVGRVVTPDSAGGGAAMTFVGLQRLDPAVTRNVLLANLRPDAAPDTADAIATANFSPPGAIPVPTSVRALRRVTAAPLLLAAVLSLLLVVAGGYLLATSVRTRRRELAVLRALGANGGQLRRIVHWHATLTGALALAIGVPAGWVLGRWIVRLMTDAIGVVPGAHIPWAEVAGGVAAVVVIVNLLAVLPARRASSAETTLVLREA